MKQKTTPTQKALNLWAVILIIWAIYRAKFQTTLPIWFDEFIAKPSVFILPVFWYITSIEKKDFLSAISLKNRISAMDIFLGLSIGLLFFASGMLGTFLKTSNPAGILEKLFSLQFVFLLFVSLATSFSEEILSRGFVLNRLYDESKNIFTAAFFASILFFFLHVPILFTNEKIVGDTLLRVMVTDLLLSLTISFTFLIRRNLMLPILIHAFYNLSIYLFM